MTRSGKCEKGTSPLPIHNAVFVLLDATELPCPAQSRELTRSDGYPERVGAIATIERHSSEITRHFTLGADKGYDTFDFVAELRRIFGKEIRASYFVPLKSSS